jgi:hypothetical protein
MTQVFADDDQVGGMGMLTRGGHVPIQVGPAMTPGKGVRPISCVGCSRDTLPRHDDGAPLCERCSDVLASAEPSVAAPRLGPSSDPDLTRSARWFRRRPVVE